MKMLLSDAAKLSLKQLWLVILVVLVILAGVFLLVSGQWNALQRLILSIGIRSRQNKLDKLDAIQKANAEVLAKDSVKMKELEDQRKQLQKDKTIAELQVQGMNHEDIVAELRRRNF